MAVDDLTRGDLEQLLEDHTEKFVGEVLRVEKHLDEKIDKRFDATDDRFERLDIKIDRLDRRTNGDVAMAYKEIEKLKNRVQVLEHATQ